jgi:glycosidase
MMKHHKILIYQIFTRLFGNRSYNCVENGTLAENGCGKMSFFDDSVLRRIKKLGVTHVWYTGVIRHASKTDYSAFGIPCQHPAVVKGRAGSPYAIVDYYDIDPDLADDVDRRMEEFEALLQRSHKAGLKVIIDFVPNHVARQYKSVKKPDGVKDFGETDDVNKGFYPDNNFYYCPNESFAPYFDLKGEADDSYSEYPAKATGNDHFDNHPGINDWYETVKLNYGIDYCDAGGRSYHFAPVPDTWHKMRDILSFWAAKGVDGFRCDMAEMVPSEFWYWCIGKIKTDYPDIVFIGEVYNPSLYRSYLGSGFDYLYDKVGMYDCLCRVICGESAASDITYQWQAVDDIKEHMLYFLENHDERRLASDFLSGNAYKALPAVVVSALLYNNPFMLYAGQEFGERGMDKEGFSGLDGRTTIFDYWTVASLYNGYVNRRKLTSDEKRLEKAYSAILNIAKKEKAVSEGMFFDLMYVNPKSDIFDSHRQYAFLRKADNEVLLVVVNFSDSDVTCGVNIPRHAFDYMQMAEKSVNATDLLTDNTVMLPLKADSAVELNIPAYGARIYKFLV